MKIENKSFSKFLSEKVDSLDYSDFQLPIEKTILFAKLKSVFFVDTAYWLPAMENSKPPYPIYFALQFRSMRNWDSTCVAIICSRNEIHLKVFNGEYGFGEGRNYIEQSIGVLDVLMDFSSLVKFLEVPFKACISHANREDFETKFPLQAKEVQ